MWPETCCSVFGGLNVCRNGQFTAEHMIGEVPAERKKRKAAEKEASRWRKRAAELQAQLEDLQLQQQQQQVHHGPCL